MARRVAAAGSWSYLDITWGQYPGGHNYHRLDRRLILDRFVAIVGGTVNSGERDAVLNLASTLIRLGAAGLTICNPCLGSQRDDKWTFEAQHPAAKLELKQFSDLPRAALIDLLLFDLHNEYVCLYGEGDLRVVPCRYNEVTSAAVEELGRVGIEQGAKEFVVGSTDLGGRGRTRRLAEQIGKAAVFCDKERLSPTEVRISVASNRELIAGRAVVLVDDILETGGTADGAARAYLGQGASAVFGVFSHACGTVEQVRNLRDQGNLARILVSDSHPQALEIEQALPEFVGVKSIVGVIRDSIADPWNWLP